MGSYETRKTKTEPYVPKDFVDFGPTSRTPTIDRGGLNFDENGQIKLRKEEKNQPTPKPKKVRFGISLPMWSSSGTSETSKLIRRLSEERMKPRFGGNKAYEQTVYDPDITKLNQSGWVQICYGREFIERSYVLATKPETLFNKDVKDYDCSTGEYFYDEQKGFYWRYTGFFD